ncbi:MAG: DUF998 domain-containing protein [Candidatus Saccharimonadales bacterium]
MAKKQTAKRRKSAPPTSTVVIRRGKRTIHVIADKVIIFRLMRNLHGRFWGVAGVLIMLGGFTACFLIRPDMLHVSTAFSDFGSDVKTAPWFAAAMFFGAYGLWRWRNYLRRTLKHSKPVIWLTGFTVAGLYVAALMPVAWEPWPYRIHMAAVTVVGVSMAATVVVDTLLTRTSRKRRFSAWWRMSRFLAFSLIVIGGWLTFGSATMIGWYHVALLGETLMLVGYTIWVIDKTYHGEGSRSALSKMLKKVVLID